MGVLSGLLTVLLGATFLLTGSVKLTPLVSPEMHNELVVKFRQAYADIWSVPADLRASFIVVVGITELVCAVLLFTPLAPLANLVLLGIMGGAIATHIRLAEPFILPASLGGALLLLFLLRTIKKAHAKPKPKKA